jgi:hypothetical protein
MQIDIAMVATPDIWGYARHSVALNADYALHHGYGFHVFTNPSKSRHATWGKVELAKALLPSCDGLFIIDADAVFVDLQKKLEDFAAIEGDLLACQNGPNGGRILNGGALFLKNTVAVNRFLETWYAFGEKYAFQHFHEQEALNDLFESGADIRIVPLPYDAFNSHFLDYNKPIWQSRFVLHVMQHSTEQRAEIFKRISEIRNGTRAVGPLI